MWKNGVPSALLLTYFVRCEVIIGYIFWYIEMKTELCEWVHRLPLYLTFFLKKTYFKDKYGLIVLLHKFVQDIVILIDALFCRLKIFPKEWLSFEYRHYYTHEHRFQMTYVIIYNIWYSTCIHRAWLTMKMLLISRFVVNITSTFLE